MKWWDRNKKKPFFIRLTQWEYWPSFAFYWPMIFYTPYLMLRSRHPCFFTPANPGMYSGGFGLESKYDTLQMIPEAYRPRTVQAAPGTPFPEIAKQLDAAGITYPLIAKPAVGFRGFLVKKVDSPEELDRHLQHFPVTFLLQEFIQRREEFGVFYYRMPGADRGQITSLTLKSFLSVTGDGRRTVAQLVRCTPRALLQWDRILRDYPHLLDRVPAAGEKVPLGVIGNHSKGTHFMNGHHLIDEQLTATFDQIARRIEGYSYGRFDIKCDSVEDLKAGRNLKIIELNGVCSEPTHMYDPAGSYPGALATVLRHWALIQRVASAHHQSGIPYHGVWSMIKAMAALKLQMRHLRRLAGSEGSHTG